MFADDSFGITQDIRRLGRRAQFQHFSGECVAEPMRTGALNAPFSSAQPMTRMLLRFLKLTSYFATAPSPPKRHDLQMPKPLPLA